MPRGRISRLHLSAGSIWHVLA